MVFCLQAAGGELLDKADELFKRADVDKNGAVDKDEFVNILGTLEESYPQIATLTKGAADGMLHDILSKFDEDGDGSLDRREFRRAMAEADSRLASHPATAQVANQQGEYLARELNARGRARRAGVEDPAPTRPFEYVHLGSFATLGGEQAALDTSGSPLPLDFTSAQSPNAYALPLGDIPLTWRYLSTLTALRLGWPAAAMMERTSGAVPRPVDHTQTPNGIFSIFFVFLHITDACACETSVTRRFVRIRIPSRLNFSSAYLLMRASYVLRMWSADCTTVIEILSLSAG